MRLDREGLYMPAVARSVTQGTARPHQCWQSESIDALIVPQRRSNWAAGDSPPPAVFFRLPCPEDPLVLAWRGIEEHALI